MILNSIQNQQQQNLLNPITQIYPDSFSFSFIDSFTHQNDFTFANTTADSRDQHIFKSMEDINANKPRFHKKSWQIIHFLDQIQKWKNIEANIEPIKIKQSINLSRISSGFSLPLCSQSAFTFDGQLLVLQNMIDQMNFKQYYKPLKKVLSGDFYSYYHCINTNTGKKVLIKAFSKQLVLGCDIWKEKMSHQVELYYELKNKWSSISNSGRLIPMNDSLTNIKQRNIIQEIYESNEALYLILNDDNFEGSLLKSYIKKNSNCFEKKQFCKLIVSMIDYLKYIHSELKIFFSKINEDDIYIGIKCAQNSPDDRILNNLNSEENNYIQMLDPSIINFAQSKKIQEMSQEMLQIQKNRDFSEIIQIFRQQLINKYKNMNNSNLNQLLFFLEELGKENYQTLTEQKIWSLFQQQQKIKVNQKVQNLVKIPKKQSQEKQKKTKFKLSHQIQK